MNRNESGSAIVEFALVIGLFLSLLLMLIDLSILYWVNVNMQNAVREGVRYSITGQTNLSDPDDPNRYDAMIEKIRISSLGYYDKLTPDVDVFLVNNDGTVQTLPDRDLGGPGDLIVVRVNCTWPLITPFGRALFDNGEYNFSVSTTMRNEVFSE